MQQPGERDLRDRDAARAGDLAHGVDRVVGALLVERREVERRSPAAGLALLVARVLAAQEAAGERAPDHQPDALRLHHRHQLALEVAAGDRVISLERGGPGEVFALGDADRLGDLPRRPVGQADITHDPAPDEAVQSLHRLLDRS